MGPLFSPPEGWSHKESLNLSYPESRWPLAWEDFPYPLPISLPLL